jgi:hypothetical protein
MGCFCISFYIFHLKGQNDWWEKNEHAPKPIKLKIWTCMWIEQKNYGKLKNSN